jgi:hypothetical protein
MLSCEYCGTTTPLEKLGKQSADDPTNEDDPRRQLEETELEIVRMKAVLDRLAEKRAALKKKRTSLKKLVNDRYCPILRFPPELTTEIFMNCFPSMGSLIIPKDSKSPFDLGQICRTWREFVRSTPALWCRVFVDLSLLKNVALVDEWLLKSGHLPLSIYLTCDLASSGRYYSHRRSTLAGVMDAVVRLSHRWHAIDLCLSASCLAPFQLPDLENRVPQLVSVSLRSRDSTLSTQGQPIRMFSIAPQLRNVELSGLLLEKVVLPMHHVTQFSLSFNSIRECLNVIDSPRLTRGVFTNILKVDSTALNAVSAPHLESLTLQSVYALTELLRLLTCPALRELVIMAPMVSLSNLASLIARSSCSLERLSLTGDRIERSELFKCLRLSPTLVELSLSSKNLGDEIMQLIDPHPDCGSSPCLLPNLEVMEYVGSFSVDGLKLGAMLLSRQGACANGEVSHLRRVSLQTKAYIRPGIRAMAQYRQLTTAGMDLSVGNDKEKWL